MKGVRGVEAPEDRAARFEQALDHRDIGERTCDDGLPRRVERGHGRRRALRLAQEIAHFAFRQAHGQHGAAGQRLHQPSALDHDAERRLEIEDARERRGHELADAVAEHRRGPHAEAGPKLRQRILDGEERRLRDGRLLQRLRGIRIVRTRTEQRAQIRLQQGLRDFQTALEGLAKGGLRRVKLTPHARKLRALSRKQKCDAPVGTARAAPPLRGFELGAGLLVRRGHDEPPLGESPAPRLQGERNVAERDVRMRAQMLRQACRAFAERALVAARQRQQVRPRLRPCLARRGVALEHEVHVGAADAEGAHAGAPRALRGGPIRERGIDVKRRRREVDMRIGSREVQRRRNLGLT